MKNDRVLSLIGIARKAGKLAAGAYQTEEAVKGGTAFLVIIAEDASGNTGKKFRNMCAYYEVPWRSYADGDRLGAAAGLENRMVMAVCDRGLAEALRKALPPEEQDKIIGTEIE